MLALVFICRALVDFLFAFGLFYDPLNNEALSFVTIIICEVFTSVGLVNVMQRKQQPISATATPETSGSVSPPAAGNLTELQNKRVCLRINSVDSSDEYGTFNTNLQNRASCKFHAIGKLYADKISSEPLLGGGAHSKSTKHHSSLSPVEIN